MAVGDHEVRGRIRLLARRWSGSGRARLRVPCNTGDNRDSHDEGFLCFPALQVRGFERGSVPGRVRSQSGPELVIGTGLFDAGLAQERGDIVEQFARFEPRLAVPLGVQGARLGQPGTGLQPLAPVVVTKRVAVVSSQSAATHPRRRPAPGRSPKPADSRPRPRTSATAAGRSTRAGPRAAGSRGRWPATRCGCPPAAEVVQVDVLGEPAAPCRPPASAR